MVTIPHPDTSISRTGRQKRSIMRPGSALDLILVTLQVGYNLKTRITLSFPNNNSRVKASTCQFCTARRPANPTNCARVAVRKSGDTAPCFFVHAALIVAVSGCFKLRPDFYFLITATRCQQVAFGTPRNTPNREKIIIIKKF